MENREDIAPGTVIAEKFRVVRQLGAGGMGVVFHVSHEGTGRSMAVKVMRRTRDSQFKGRFMAEARAACAVEHPAIAAVPPVAMRSRRFLRLRSASTSRTSRCFTLDAERYGSPSQRVDRIAALSVDERIARRGSFTRGASLGRALSESADRQID